MIDKEHIAIEDADRNMQDGMCGKVIFCFTTSSSMSSSSWLSFFNFDLLPSFCNGE